MLFDRGFYASQLKNGPVEALDFFLSPEGYWLNPHPLFDSRWYLDQNPDVLAAGINPLIHYLETGWRELRSPCALFNVPFFLSNLSPICMDGDPLSFYLRNSAAIDANPHPLFDAKFYLSQLRERVSKLPNPLLDYVTHGWREGLNPHPLFDVDFYFQQNPDVKKASLEPLQHYLALGWKAGSNPHPLFDLRWYLEHNSDIRESGVEPLQHYLSCGWREGRNPHILFNSSWYWAQRQDGPSQLQNPALHYVSVGWKQKRSPSAFFDEAFYQSEYFQHTARKRAGLSDYLSAGAEQNRNPNRWFDTRWYRSQNRALKSGKLNPLTHYALFGAKEGKRTRPLATLSKRSNSLRERARVMFISGEPRIPGHRYRVVQAAQALPRKDFAVSIINVAQIPKMLHEITECDLVWVWRAAMSPEIELLIAAHRQRIFALIYDLDDMMFLPELAVPEEIDAIRSQNLPPSEVQRHYESVRQVLLEADRCTAPTDHLAAEIRRCDKPATVIPNGFDQVTLRIARLAACERKSQTPDGYTRIGYASGTLTHQRDLAQAACALAALLRENPKTRLVLFRGTVRIEEFPEFEEVEDQIEWRDTVPLKDLPAEYARFDISIAPLEIGNRFCECKSELKYFEAALVNVPTVASATGAYATVIRHGENGFLARSTDDWYDCLDRLLRKPDLRTQMGESAYRNALWQYGPERRSTLVTALAHQLLSPPAVRSQLFRLEISEDHFFPPAAAVPDYNVIFELGKHGHSRVSVVIPLHNYAQYVEEALDSLLQQTLRNIEIVVVDDRSTDNSLEVAHRWFERYGSRFSKVALLQNKRNSNLGRTRNAGIHFSDTELYMPLDADNALLPDCLEICLRALDETGAAYAYPTIAMFGDRHDLIGTREFDPALFRCMNFIDAMAMVRKACWIAVGGYSPLEPVGWEDYEFWCKLAEKGFFGVHVPEPGARYRSHPRSMLANITDRPDVKPLVIAEMNRRHGWLQLLPPDQIKPATPRR